MAIEWIVRVLLSILGVIVSLISTLLPGVTASAGQVLGTAMQLNAVLPVSEALACGGLILGWRLVSGPLTAVLGRVELFGLKFW